MTTPAHSMIDQYHPNSNSRARGNRHRNRAASMAMATAIHIGALIVATTATTNRALTLIERRFSRARNEA
jgi:hypothetical protein